MESYHVKRNLAGDIIGYGQERHARGRGTGARTVAILTVSAKVIAYATGFALFFLPKGYALPGAVYDLWRVAIIAVGIVLSLLHVGSRRATARWCLLVGGTLFYYVLSTLLAGSDGSPYVIATDSASVVGFVTLLDRGLSRDGEACLRGLVLAGIVMCGAHYLTFLRYASVRGGMRHGQAGVSGQHWFLLTHDNGSVFYFLPVATLLWYMAVGRGEFRRTAVAFTALVLYMYWSLWSVAAMVVFTAFVACCVVVWRVGVAGPLRLLTWRRTVVVGLAACAAVTLLYSASTIVDIALYFGKNSGLGRASIWSRAYVWIARSPILGQGFEADATTQSKILINHCHNMVLQLLYTGGVVTFALFALAFLRCGDAGPKGRLLTPGQAVLCLGALATFAAGAFDWYLYMPVQFLPFVLYAHSSRAAGKSE